MSEEKRIKIGHTPLTNSGCESNFGDLKYDVTRSAVSHTKMNIINNESMIRKNLSKKSENKCQKSRERQGRSGQEFLNKQRK